MEAEKGMETVSERNKQGPLTWVCPWPAGRGVWFQSQLGRLSHCVTRVHLFDTRVIHLLIEAHYNSVYLPLGVCEA